MNACGIKLMLVVALAVVSCATAQEAPPQLTERQAEVAAVVDSLLKALIAGDVEAIKQALRLPLLAVVEFEAGSPAIVEIGEGRLAEEVGAAAAARYGAAKQVQLVKPTVVLLAWNVAAIASPVQWKDVAGNVLLDEGIAALLRKDAGGWGVATVMISGVRPPEPDEATRQQIAEVVDGAVKAIMRQDEESYVAAFSVPTVDIDPERGVRRLGLNELRAGFRQFGSMLLDAGVVDARIDMQRLVMLGPNVACAVGIAKGLDGAGAQIGHRPQGVLLVKEAEKWKIVAQAAGTPAEGTAPERLPGLPAGD